MQACGVHGERGIGSADEWEIRLSKCVERPKRILELKEPSQCDLSMSSKGRIEKYAGIEPSCVQLTWVGMLCCMFCTHLILRREVLDDLCYSLEVRLNPIFPGGKHTRSACRTA